MLKKHEYTVTVTVIIAYTLEVQKMTRWKKFQTETWNARNLKFLEIHDQLHTIKSNQMCVTDEIQVLAQVGDLAIYSFFCRN